MAYPDFSEDFRSDFRPFVNGALHATALYRVFYSSAMYSALEDPALHCVLHVTAIHSVLQSNALYSVLHTSKLYSVMHNTTLYSELSAAGLYILLQCSLQCFTLLTADFKRLTVYNTGKTESFNCTLHAKYCSVQFTMHTALYCTQHTAHCTVYTAHYILYTIQSTQ